MIDKCVWCKGSGQSNIYLYDTEKKEEFRKQIDCAKCLGSGVLQYTPVYVSQVEVKEPIKILKEQVNELLAMQHACDAVEHGNGD